MSGLTLALLLTACVRIDADERELRSPIWADVSVGGDATCAVRDTDGTVRCWADDDSVSGWSDVTPLDPQAEVVSVGYRHACVIDSSDESSLCFGNSIVVDGEPDDDHPGPLSSLEVGVDKACGLHFGEVVCWDHGPNWANGMVDLPEGDVVDYAVQGDACAIVDATLTCWGDSGRTPELDTIVPTRVAMGEDNAVCVLDDAETVWCSDTTTPSRPLEEAGTGFADIEVAYDGFGCGLTPDGAIACFGMVPDALADIPGGRDWVDLSVGDRVACAVDQDGFLGCWGNRDDGHFPR